jgi:histidyl-tRNA synthetase
MTDQAAKLCRLPAGGGWAIAAPGLEPVGIVAGEIFEVQDRGVWWRARMNPDGTAEGARMVAGHANRVPIELREGMRAGFFDGREKFAKPLAV